MAVADFIIKEEFTPFKLFKYWDATSNTEIASTAIAPIKTDLWSGQLMIVQRPNEEGKVILVSDKNKQKVSD